MSLDPLATAEDVEVRLGRDLTVDETTQIEAILADVSAAIRAYIGQDITAGTSTDERIRARGASVRLPQRPVTAVDSVKSVDGGSAISFTWYAGDIIDLGCAQSTGWVDVTYDHGFEEVPADLVALTCNIALRVFGTPAEQGGLQSESIGTYSYSIGGAAAAGPIGLLDDERSLLDDSYRRALGSARVAW